MSENLICLNGKLVALNKFITQLKELNKWVIEKKIEAEEINQKPSSEKKISTEKLHVLIIIYSYIKLYFITFCDIVLVKFTRAQC